MWGTGLYQAENYISRIPFLECSSFDWPEEGRGKQKLSSLHFVGVPQISMVKGSYEVFKGVSDGPRSSCLSS